MKKRLYERSILARFLIVATISTVVAVLMQLSEWRLVSAERWVAHSHKVMFAIERVLSLLDDAESGQRGLLLSGSERYLKPYRVALNETAPTLASLARLTRDNPTEQQDARQLEALAGQKLALMSHTLDLFHRQKPEEALKSMRSGRGLQLMESIREVIARMKTEERQLLTQRVARAATLGRVVTALVWAGWSGNLLTLALALRLVAREAARRNRVESALADSERRFHAIFDQTFEFIGLCDPEGTVLETNRTALDFAGLSRADEVGRPIWQTRFWSSSPGTAVQLEAAVRASADGLLVRDEFEIVGRRPANRNDRFLAQSPPRPERQGCAPDPGRPRHHPLETR